MSDEYFEQNEPARGGTDRYHHLVEHIQDAVVEFELVDGEPVVRGVNSAFVDVFGYDYDDLQGESLNEWIVPEWLADEAEDLDERTSTGEINYRRVKRETADGLREFLYRGIPYGTDETGTDGFAVYTDLTEITRTERRLQVMNRVLRHNLRNKTNVIVGLTSQLLDEFEDQTGERTATAATLERAADDLRELTRETDEINAVLANPDHTDFIDCVPLIHEAVTEHRERSPRATIETDLPESLVVNANTHFKAAVDSLVDNAITHNPAADPRVRVRVSDTGTDRWVTVCVDDDGPPIPANERRVLTGATEITQKQHGRGLGLWLVKWTAESFGGELLFETSDLGGNSVRIRLPRE